MINEINLKSLTGKNVKILKEDQARLLLFFDQEEFILDYSLAQSLMNVLIEFLSNGSRK